MYLAQGAAHSLSPVAAFDNGALTAFRYPGNMSQPAVFKVIDNHEGQPEACIPGGHATKAELEAPEQAVNTRVVDAITTTDRRSRVIFPRSTRLMNGSSAAVASDAAGAIAMERLRARASAAGIEVHGLVPVFDDINTDLMRLGAPALVSHMAAQLHPTDRARFCR
jgi:hypothetical protein